MLAWSPLNAIENASEEHVRERWRGDTGSGTVTKPGYPDSQGNKAAKPTPALRSPVPVKHRERIRWRRTFFFCEEDPTGIRVSLGARKGGQGSGQPDSCEI